MQRQTTLGCETLDHRPWTTDDGRWTMDGGPWLSWTAGLQPAPSPWSAWTPTLPQGPRPLDCERLARIATVAQGSPGSRAPWTAGVSPASRSSHRDSRRLSLQWPPGPPALDRRPWTAGVSPAPSPWSAWTPTFPQGPRAYSPHPDRLTGTVGDCPSSGRRAAGPGPRAYSPLPHRGRRARRPSLRDRRLPARTPIVSQGQSPTVPPVAAGIVRLLGRGTHQNALHSALAPSANCHRCP